MSSIAVCLFRYRQRKRSCQAVSTVLEDRVSQLVRQQRWMEASSAERSLQHAERKLARLISGMRAMRGLHQVGIASGGLRYWYKANHPGQRLVTAAGPGLRV